MSFSNVNPACVAAGGNLLASGSVGAATAETAANANTVTNEVVECLIVNQVNRFPQQTTGKHRWLQVFPHASQKSRFSMAEHSCRTSAWPIAPDSTKITLQIL